MNRLEMRCKLGNEGRKRRNASWEEEKRKSCIIFTLDREEPIGVVGLLLITDNPINNHN